MDGTRLFYYMKVDNSLATKQLDGRMQNKERIVSYCNVDGVSSISFLSQDALRMLSA